MAGFFDKMVESINKGVNSVSEGSKVIIEKANINTKIKDTEKDKLRVLQNLGATVYNLHASGEIKLEQCEALCGEIEAMDRQIIALQQQLQALEPVKTTTTTTAPPADCITCECGHVNNSGAKFCAGCGKEL